MVVHVVAVVLRSEEVAVLVEAASVALAAAEALALVVEALAEAGKFYHIKSIKGMSII